ncbi:hypothetical protein QKC54_gp0552 [Megavirus baoshan]|uniref:Uncharacterized protein n=1 Tax=Megavirus baoshan TaxID=2496520 RepID=A0A3Q8U7Y2_9VIRU|nr:hypothetical protein QKC54_gp0552 [Megavirus baoshan]AZL89280.1 hypothetical protein Mb0520 [Megavirus baoshan]
MGNNSSRENISETNDISMLKEYWNKQSRGYKNSDEIYPEQYDKNGYVNHLNVYNDPNHNIYLPYISDKKDFDSDYEPTIVSDTASLRYVEIEICEDDFNKYKEKYAVNKSRPRHDCGPNCPCIGDSESCIISRQNNIEQDIYSPTSENPYIKNMKGGANNILSNTSINDNNDITSDMLSTTSDSDMLSATSDSDNTSEPNFTLRKNNGINKSNNKSLNNKISDNNLIFDSDDINTTVSIDDEDDTDDEILEDIDDEIEESGFAYDKSDIATSDLYEMQKRIFQSSDYDNRDNELSTDFSDNSLNINDDDDTTENVRWAMQRINLRKTLFDEEDNDILQMNSPSDNFDTRPIKRNNKYQ